MVLSSFTQYYLSHADFRYRGITAAFFNYSDTAVITAVCVSH